MPDIIISIPNKLAKTVFEAIAKTYNVEATLDGMTEYFARHIRETVEQSVRQTHGETRVEALVFTGGLKKPNPPQSPEAIAEEKGQLGGG